jgi:hypothetical protein
MKKILFTLKLIEGSGGGGCFFVKNMVDYLNTQHPGEFNIVTSLEPNIDLIFMIDPRKNMTNMFSLDDIMKYKQNHPNCKTLYAVNECDIKREVNINLEPLILKTIMFCDHNIFISKWLKQYYYDKYPFIQQKINNAEVIFNACDLNHYYPDRNRKLNKNSIKLVTHHWSDNYFKGFEIYNKLDQLLGKDEYKYIQFTYIGRYNTNKYVPRNLNYIPPISGELLGNELRKHDIYLTASLFEPGGIHQLEGMASGLPILYRENGGGIKESVRKAGEEFKDIEDLFEKLKKIIENYEQYCNNIDYDFISHNRFGKAYADYFINKVFI